jgi:hypothetical protein
VPSRYPSVGILDRVAAAEDLEAILELESWTNDRISTELGLLHLLPRDEWVTGAPMASVVMAAFCHPAPSGARFSTAERGAWYAGRSLDTALAESTYRRTRELEEVGSFETRVQMRLYHADFSGSFPDLRGRRRQFPSAYDPESYEASQQLGRALSPAAPPACSTTASGTPAGSASPASGRRWSGTRARPRTTSTYGRGGRSPGCGGWPEPSRYNFLFVT